MSENSQPPETRPKEIQIDIISSLTQISADGWNALNPQNHPFTSHQFLYCLENSGSVGGDSGWEPCYLLAKDADGQLIGALPLYLKYHSYGEYVFDHGWAHAFERAGGRYYPKLLGAVPFTPVPGPRLLIHDDNAYLAPHIIDAIEQLMRQHGLSSAHLNFLIQKDIDALKMKGWLIRKGLQFHWHNQNYSDFDHFLSQLSSRKRKNIRKERQSLYDKGVEFRQLTADKITPSHWDSFYQFYLSTIERKWGGAYLTEAFFHQIGEMMADNILLVMAFQDNQPVAAALNFIGSNTLYGRNWGCSVDLPNLHFETCYYQAIEFAIAHGLAKVEAGAQGFHKVQRGYMPCYTYSAHKLSHQGMSDAVQRFIDEEGAQIDLEARAIAQASPYRTQD